MNPSDSKGPPFGTVPQVTGEEDRVELFEHQGHPSAPDELRQVVQSCNAIFVPLCRAGGRGHPPGTRRSGHRVRLTGLLGAGATVPASSLVKLLPLVAAYRGALWRRGLSSDVVVVTAELDSYKPAIVPNLYPPRP